MVHEHIWASLGVPEMTRLQGTNTCVGMGLACLLDEALFPKRRQIGLVTDVEQWLQEALVCADSRGAAVPEQWLPSSLTALLPASQRCFH